MTREARPSTTPEVPDPTARERCCTGSSSRHCSQTTRHTTPVCPTTCRSAANAKVAFERITAARSRGRSPQRCGTSPRTSERQRRSTAATACYPERRQDSAVSFSSAAIYGACGSAGAEPRSPFMTVRMCSIRTEPIACTESCRSSPSALRR